MSRLAFLALALALAAACDRAPAPPEAPPPAAPPSGAIYQCSMHPQIIRTEPGACPICGMALTRADAPERPTAGVPGHAAFTLSPERQQLIGVTRAPVAMRDLTRTIRLPATVANDMALYEALIEYREALRTRGAIGRTTLREAGTGADALVRAAAPKLHRHGIGDRELATLAGIDPTTFILPGPRVWVYAQAFEDDATLVGPGMPITIEVPSTGRTYPSTVFSVAPIVATDTRTVRIRALVSTPDAELRPETYVTASLRIPLGERLALPRDAVLESGTRQLVFVVDDAGRFDPRAVRLGRSADGWVEVFDGVAAGEQVVTSANFLIDSESRLKAALAAFEAPPADAH
jgi:Cu(I)/Ag(I) efflux system membrane fusion protein